MKRRIQRMAAAAVVMLAVVLIPECGVSVFAEETAENMNAQELAVNSAQLAQDAQAAANLFAVQAQAAQQELEAARNEAAMLTSAAATQEEIEAAAASAVRYLEAKAAAEELTVKAEVAQDNAEHAKNVAQIHAEDARRHFRSVRMPVWQSRRCRSFPPCLHSPCSRRSSLSRHPSSLTSQHLRKSACWLP